MDLKLKLVHAMSLRPKLSVVVSTHVLDERGMTDKWIPVTNLCQSLWERWHEVLKTMMEDVLPSYEAATARDPWQLVADTIQPDSLCALMRVNRKLHRTCLPILWGNPAAHFFEDTDDSLPEHEAKVVVALTRFLRALRWVRLSVREMTHTLCLPPPVAELHGGPGPEWLRDILEQLPKLQSLIVSRLPCFDHKALLALRSPTHLRGATTSIPCTKFPLRLLVAAGCRNATSKGLVEALDHFPDIAYLDLSNTLAARDRCVLARLSALSSLHVLKLRGVHLRDEDLIVLAEAVGIRLRSLDVRANQLTDRSIRALLSFCFTRVDASGMDASRATTSSSPGITASDWPTEFSRLDPALSDEFQDGMYDERLVRRLTRGVVSSLPYEDLPHSGLSHMWVSDNNLSVTGLAALIRSKRLCVLDAGSVDAGDVPWKAHLGPSSSSGASDDHHQNLGVQELAPVLSHSGQCLTFLRMRYTLVTEKAPRQGYDTLSVTCEFDLSDQVRGLEATVPPIQRLNDCQPPLYSCNTKEAVPEYKPTGTGNHFASQPIGKRPEASQLGEADVQRGGVYIPGPRNDGHEKPLLCATDASPLAQRTRVVGEIMSLHDSLHEVSGPSVTDCDVELSSALLEKHRIELRMRQLTNLPGLTPGMLPKLRTLILTEVPCYETTPKVSDALIQFVKYCAAEAELTNLQARLEARTVPKPGRIRTSDHRHNTHAPFALRRIVLEMEADEPWSAISALSPHLVKPSKFVKRTMSSTEDADSEALWIASQDDFTFFDTNQVCRVRVGGMTTDDRPSTTSGRRFTPTKSPRNGHLPSIKELDGRKAAIDVVGQLAKFRRERKNAYENALNKGLPNNVDGHWHGEITIVRA
ncbi:MAG: hypothetical protein Q9163_002862 [Psora crenata]